MCEVCVKAVEKYFPDCPKEEYNGFLMSATAFPFGDGSVVERQLREAKDAGCKTWEDAIVYANEQTEKEMKQLSE